MHYLYLERFPDIVIRNYIYHKFDINKNVKINFLKVIRVLDKYIKCHYYYVRK